MATFTPVDLSGDTQTAVRRELAKGVAGGKRPTQQGPPDAPQSKEEIAADVALAEADQAQSERDLPLSYRLPGETIITAPANAPKGFTPLDLGESKPPQGFTPMDLTGGKPVRSGGIPTTEKKPFHPGQIFDWVVNPIDPELKTDLFGQAPKETVDGTQPFHPGQMIGHVGDAIRGGAYDLASMLVDTALTPLTYLTAPIIGTPVPKVPITPATKVLTQIDLDTQIAERALATGYPDEVENALIPTVRRPTGKMVFGPTFDTGIHPMTGGGTSRRNALGDKIRLPSQMETGEYPTVLPGQLPLEMQIEQGVLGPHGTPRTTFADYARTQVGHKIGEIPEGAQGELLGGLFREGQAGVPGVTGPHVLQQGEQLEMGLVPLREQRLIIPAHARMNKIVADEIVEEINGVFTAEEVAKHKPGWRQLGFVTEADRGPAFGKTVHEPPPVVLPTPEEQSLLKLGPQFPKQGARVIPAVTDVMRKYGSLGNQMADLTDWVYGTRARDTTRDVTALDAALTKAVGARGFWNRQYTNATTPWGDNPFIKSLRKHWNLAEADIELIFNHLDSGGVEPVPPRLQPVADALFELGTKPASIDPGVQTLMVKDPLTGREYPVGAPSKFMPHRPATRAAADAISDAHWGALYQREGGEQLGVSQAQFKERVLAVLNRDPVVVVAESMRGLETSRSLDLGALGGSRYQWAKKLGLETDPYRLVVNFNSAARLRGNMAQIEKPMQQLLDAVPAEDTAAKEWLTLAHKRIMVRNNDFDMHTDLSATLRGVSHVTDVLLLPLGGLANLSQVIYPVARAGIRNTLRGFGSMLTPADRLIVNQSGSLFPSLLNEVTRPTGPMATLSSAAFSGYQLRAADGFTRFFAGHVGNAAIRAWEKGFLRTPGSLRLQGLLKEVGGDLEVILQTKKIPDDMRLLMIQKFANMTAGVTDARGVGLFLTNENPIYKLVNKYRSFGMANAAEIQRMVLNAPDLRTGVTRGLTLLAGAYAVGGGINELRKALRDSLMGHEAPKDKKGTADLLERLALGLGAAHGMLLVQLAKDPEHAIISAVTGPAIGLIGRVTADLWATGKEGVGWRSVDTLSAVGPTGPVLGPLVDAEKKKEARRLSEYKADRAGMIE